MSFISAYPGECEHCGGELKGRAATYVGSGDIVHVTCPAPEQVCPKCNLALPATGVCDDCG